MNPRMREKGGGTPIQPENGFQIRNPWIPQTPGNQVMSGSNGISSDRIGSQLGKRNWNEFFGLLDRRPNRGSDGLNQSSGSYNIGDQRMAGVIPTGPVNQISASRNLGNNQQMGNQVSQGGKNISLRPQMNRISGSNTMVDPRMGNGTSGQYFNSQSRIYRSDIPSWRNSPMVSNRLLIGNTVQEPSFPATNVSPSISTRTDPVTMPYLNPNPQQLSSPRGMNQTNSTLQLLNSSRGVNQMNSPSQQLSSTRGMNQMNPPLQQLCSPTGMSQTNSDHAPSILNSYSEIDSTWTGGNFTSLLLGIDIQAANTNKWINVDDMPQMCNNGFHVPVQENNDLISPSKNGAGTSNANSFPFAPITPDYRNLLEKHRQAELLKFLVDDGSGQEHEKMENLISSIGDKAIENQCSELLQSIVGSSTVISTPQAENKISEESTVHEVIDLNETPKQKATKRRKHRPKVVIEGKPKRMPKPKTPKNVEVEENPSKKRKYVRKNKDAKVENITPQQTTPINIEEVSNSESRGESCRRKLNFDSGNAEKGENQYMAGNIEGTHYQGNQIVPDLNLNFPANQMPVESMAAGKDNCPSVVQTEIVNYNTSNAIARNLIPGSNERRDNPNTNGELNKSISRPNFNIEKSKDIRWKNTYQMVERDVGNFKGFYESKDGDFHPTKQAGPSSDPKLSSPSICQEPFQSETQGTLNPAVGTSSGETPAKLKIPNGVQKISNRPVKRRFVNSASARNTINSDNSIPDKLTTLKQQMVLERMRERMSSRSNQGHGTGCLPVMTKSNQQSAASKAKKANVLGHQQQTENHKASIQNSEIRMTANDCRIVSFCRKEPNENLHQYQPPSVTARGQQKSMKYTKKVVDEITIQLQRLSINSETGETDGKDKYALVPYGGGGALVTYEPKKRKPRPKVDLDPETTRIWKLLMGKEGSEDPEAENRNKEKWWEEERGVFHGRAESFIARMHLVQGDRRFSPWKGSVVDSIIGVFLTQNVSDQLSSSAFMALAARFPLGVATPDQTSDQSGTSILTEELEIQGLTQGGAAGCFEKIIRQPFSSGNFSDISINHINGEIQSSSGSSSEVEDSSNGGKSIKNNDLTALRQADTTTPLQIVENHENRSLNFNDMSANFNKQSAEISNNRQRSGTDRPNNLNSFSPLNQPVSSSMSSMQNSAMPLSFFQLLMAPQVARTEVDCSEISREEFRSSFHSSPPEMSRAYQANRDRHTIEMMSDNLSQQNGFQNNHMPNIDRFDFLMKPLAVQDSSAKQGPQIVKNVHHQEKISQVYEPEHRGYENPSRPNETVNTLKSGRDHVPSASKHTVPMFDFQERTSAANKQVLLGEGSSHGHGNGQASSSGGTIAGKSAKTLDTSLKRDKEKREAFDWDSLRKTAQASAGGKERTMDASDSMDYEAMRCADVNVISDSIRIRGMNNMLSERIKDFLNRVVRDHGSIDLEWLRDVPPDKAKDYLLSIRGLGLKSVECVRLLTLHHLAFPVDTNVGRIAVRLGWVPLQPLPESLQLHLLEMYPVLESVQKYLWPRLCKLDQKTLYELHYQLITFGKVFCTKSKPNCNACPMRGECRHFASAFASARLALPAPEEKGIVSSTMPIATDRRAHMINPVLLQPSCSNGERELTVNRCEPIIEEPASPEPEIIEIAETDIEDAFYEDPDEIPTIRLNVEQLAVNLRNFMEEHTNLQEGDMSRALVALTPEVASIPVPKLKYVLRLRTERQVYVLPDTHPLVRGLDKREPDDPSPYLLALLAPGEEAGSGQSSKTCSGSNGSEKLCKEKECSPVIEEENSLTVRGTLLIPCRTAMRGSFPLNGTYFQVNEVFADHESSLKPIDVPRAWLWHLETRTVLFGTSATSIFRGMTTKEIQSSFWRGFVCVRGFDRKTRAPRPLNRNLHIPHSKTVKTSNAA